MWCDALSVTVGLVDIVVVAAIGVCFVYIKVKSMSVEAVKDEGVPVDSSKKKRRLSSRELMIEMATQQLQTNNQTTEEKGEEGGEVIVTLGINPMHANSGAAETPPEKPPEPAAPTAARARWNKIKLATRTSRTFREGGKQRMKRLSKVMKARQNEAGGLVDDAVKTVADSIHLDAATGRRYRYNEATGETQWLDDSEAATNEEESEINEETKRKTFRKFVNDDDDVYYENIETGEVVWDMPEDGELGF